MPIGSYRSERPPSQTYPKPFIKARKALVFEEVTVEAASWKNVFESIRPEDQKSLVVRSVDALEIAVEAIARVETEVVMIKGRIAGSADGRRVFIIPYDKLSTVYVNRIVANDEIILFSPSVSVEDKQRIAHEVEEKAQRVKQSEQEMATPVVSEEISPDVKAELEELKRLAQNQPTSNGVLSSRSKDVIPSRLPSAPERRPGPGRLSLPDPPRAR